MRIVTSMLLAFQIALLSGCGNKDFDSYTFDEARAYLLQPLSTMTKGSPTKNELEEIENEFCDEAEESNVRLVILDELSSQNIFFKTVESTAILGGGKATRNLVVLHKLLKIDYDPDPFDQIRTDMKKYGGYEAFTRKVTRLGRLIRGEKISQSEVSQALESASALMCAMSKIKLSLLGEEVDIVEEISSSVISEYRSVLSNTILQHAQADYRDAQLLLKQLEQY